MESDGRERLFIWGKTYPELSTKHFETVCTAAVRASGQPVRLYPISYRYLDNQFSKYQWITARIWKNERDPRPESYRIDCDSITVEETVRPTFNEWGQRAEILFRDPTWSFDSVDCLLTAQQQAKTSIGVVTPRQILAVGLSPRSDSDRQSFDQKFQELKKNLNAKRLQTTFFEDDLPKEMKRLEFIDVRLQISWLCGSGECSGHKMQVLDWEVCELQRRQGHAAALSKFLSICDLKKYALKFFLGNLRLYPNSFMIVGLWYPLRSNLLFG
jgi:hypothetical protein